VHSESLKYPGTLIMCLQCILFDEEMDTLPLKLPSSNLLVRCSKQRNSLGPQQAESTRGRG
jgi:hypothetical protein